jgi:simple sugar transport system ATP-binding protein
MPELLELKSIRKTFFGTTALANVDFDLRAGEIHALMGENGAGKSTLIKSMTGVYLPDAGEIRVQGEVIRPASPADAVRAGISTVYQEVNLVPNLSVMENLLLGRESRSLFGINWAEMRVRAERALKRVGVQVDVRARLGSLSIAVQQLVAIARALDVEAKVLILDEPTSSLDAEEVDNLFAVMRRLRDDGMGIIFVTHFMDQVYAVSDRITVLRNGTKVGTWEAKDLPRLQLVSEMIGRDASALSRDADAKPIFPNGKVIVTAKNLGKRGSVAGINYSISQGDTLGIAGLLGSGRTETARLLFGIDAPDTGELLIDGNRKARLRPSEAIRLGIGYCSEDRKLEGIFPELTVRENMLILYSVKRGLLSRLNMAKQRELSAELMRRLNVQPPDMERQIQFLSGGNQQKALLARWLLFEPRLLILDEPTRGIDVGAKFEIMTLVETLRQAGSAFVFISSELPEVVRSSTKVIVMRDRVAVGELESADVTEANIIREIAA